MIKVVIGLLINNYLNLMIFKSRMYKNFIIYSFNFERCVNSAIF